MTNYNERLDEIVWKTLRRHRKMLNGPVPFDLLYGEKEPTDIVFEEAKQAITSLIKELVAEAKPYRETIIDKWNKDRIDEVKATNAAMNAWADIYEQNLLKALEEL